MRSGFWRAGVYLPPETLPSIEETPSAYYDWRLSLYHKSGGKKKDWYWGLENIPINTIQFEENKRLLGNASLTLAYVDFPIDTDDILEIYYKGDKKWEGIVDEKPDLKGGKIKLVPFSQKLDERLVNLSFSSASYSTALFTIIDGLDDVGITWNESFINIDSTDVFSQDFNYVSAKKSIEEIMKNLPDREWGVDEQRRFRVYKPSTTLNKVVQNSEDKWYKSLEITNDDKRIKATRYEVFKKSTDSGKTIRVGNVGYDLPDGDYPTLSIEDTKRRKDKKFTVSASVTDVFAKDLAYADLQGQAELSTNIKLKDFRFDKYNGEIGQLLRVVDDYERILITYKTTDSLEITDSTTGWTGNVNNYTDDFVSGNASLQLVASGQREDAFYDFGEVLRYKTLEKIIFMIQSMEDTGDLIQVGLSNTTATLWDNPYNIFVNSENVWEMKEFTPDEKEFRYLGVRLNNIIRDGSKLNLSGETRAGSYISPSFSEYFFDRFQAFTRIRNEAEGNIVQKKYKLDRKGDSMQMVLGDYELQDNQELIDLNKELDKIKQIQQTT